MPRATKTVKLSVPFSIFGKSHTEVVMKEPSARQFLDLGPLTANYRIGAIDSATHVPDLLVAYLEKCVTNIDPSTIVVMLDELPIEDGMRISREFEGFFTDAFSRVLATEAAAAEARLQSAINP